MRTYDLTPLFRTSVGFDRMSRLMESALQLEGAAKGYPPYNIVRKEQDQYRITLAVAGFAEDELGIELHNNLLTITGRKDKDEAGQEEYLYQGIASRGFERRFQLADHIKVLAANMDNGLLHVELERVVPEALKPRSIPIGMTTSARALSTGEAPANPQA